MSINCIKEQKNTFHWALTLLTANRFFFESFRSPPHGHNSSEVHRCCQPKIANFSFSRLVKKQKYLAINIKRFNGQCIPAHENNMLCKRVFLSAKKERVCECICVFRDPILRSLFHPNFWKRFCMGKSYEWMSGMTGCNISHLCINPQ
jgi:hypothetical protein